MNQLEQMKKERDPKEMLLMTGCPNCGQDNNIEYVKNVIDEIRVNAYLAGQQAERIKNNLCKHGVQGNCLACYNEHNLINSKE